MGPRILMPALLTRISIRPNSRSTSSARRSTSASFVTSAAKAAVLRPVAPAIPFAASSHVSFERPASATVAPASASAIAMVLPRPRAPPVTSATLPSSRNRSITLFCATSTSRFLKPFRDDSKTLFPRLARSNVLQVVVNASVRQVHRVRDAGHRLQADEVSSRRRVVRNTRRRQRSVDHGGAELRTDLDPNTLFRTPDGQGGRRVFATHQI